MNTFVNEIEIDRERYRETERHSVNTSFHTLVPGGPGTSYIKGETQAMTISHSEMVTFRMCS